MSPIYVPEVATTGTALSDIVLAVNRRLSNYLGTVRQTETGDGVTTAWKLLAENIVVNSVAATVDAVAAPYTLDPDGGWLTFDDHPDDGVAVIMSYRYAYWSEDQVVEAINAAIDELFAWFYRTDEYTFTSTGAQEYRCQDADGNYLDAEDRVTRVDYWSSPDWVRLDGWEQREVASRKYVHFTRTPAAGQTMRFTYARRPASLESGTDDLTEVAGLPARAKEPIVLFACSDLIAARIGPRIREDRAHNTQNENPIKSYELVNDSQFFRSRAEAKAARLRKAPLRPRIVT